MRRANAESRARDERCLVLSVQGYSYSQICPMVGLSAKSSVSEAIRRATVRLATEVDVESARAESLSSVKALREHLWQRLHNLPPLVDRVGRVVTDPSTGQRVPDTHAEAVIAAALLRVEARMASLLGLDAPQRTEVWSIGALDAVIAQAEAEITARSQRAITS